jgi:hypothetical protein
MSEELPYEGKLLWTAYTQVYLNIPILIYNFGMK